MGQFLVADEGFVDFLDAEGSAVERNGGSNFLNFFYIFAGFPFRVEEVAQGERLGIGLRKHQLSLIFFINLLGDSDQLLSSLR